MNDGKRAARGRWRAAARPAMVAVAGGAALGGAAVPAVAQDTAPPGDVELAGRITGLTDYRYRGLSYSGGDPAAQAEATVTHVSGFYGGAFASTIHGGDAYGEVELDLFGGWRGPVSSGLTLDAGMQRYVFAAADAGPTDYWEPYAALSGTLGPATARAGINYAWSQAALGDRSNLYAHGELEAGVPTTPVTLTAHAGYTDGVFLPLARPGGARDREGFDFAFGGRAVVRGALTASLAFTTVEAPLADGISDDTVVAGLSLSF